MSKIEACYYRVSVKALVLNDARDKFLVCEKKSGVFELPGGGLEWGEEVKAELAREIREEMDLAVTEIADRPAYFLTGQTLNSHTWVANVVYETKLENLDFKPSDECVSIKFINQDNLEGLRLFPAVRQLAENFKS